MVFDVLKFPADIFIQLHHLQDVLIIAFTGIGQPERRGAAIKQFYAQIRLQPFQILTERRLGDIQVLSRFC